MNLPAIIHAITASQENDKVDAKRTPWIRIAAVQNETDGAVVEWVYLGRKTITKFINITTKIWGKKEF